MNPEYYDILRKQINKQPIMSDQNILNERKKEEYLYNPAALELVSLTLTHSNFNLFLIVNSRL